MATSNTITTDFGTNLSSVIHLLGLRNKLAADEIGISYNTLSNIINQKFPPSKESIERIEAFVTRKGLDTALLYKQEPSVLNFRIRIDSPLSGNEKSALRNTRAKIEHQLIILYDLEHSNFDHNKHIDLVNYFDLYALPYGNCPVFYSCERLSEFQNIIQKEKRSPEQWADYFLKPKDKDFWGNLYYGISTGNLDAFNIIYLVESLGIRLHFMSFGTEKVKSCSTSLFTNHQHDPNSVWAEPAIILNTDACDCAEKCLFATAEEFFHMIEHPDDYAMLNVNEFILEDAKKHKDAETFATELLLPEERIRRYLEQRKGKDLTVYELTDMKQRLRVCHDVLLRRLKELNVCNVKAQDYLDALNLFYTDLKEKLPYRNSEPEPLPLSDRGSDFFECAILAAYQAELITEKEAVDCLDCTPEALKSKTHKERFRRRCNFGAAINSSTEPP